MAGTGKITISVESLKEKYDRAVEVKDELETITANQQKLRKETVERLKGDESLKTQAEEISDKLTELLEPYFDTDQPDNQRVLPLLEDIVKDYASKAREHTENFVMTQTKEQSESAQNRKTALNEEWEKVTKEYKALEVVMEMMNLDRADVPALPDRRGARGGGAGGAGSGSRGGKTRNFRFAFTKDGEEYAAWENLSRALFYTSKGSGGGGSEGRLGSKEFEQGIFKSTFGHTDTWKESWEITLPNNTKLGFVRHAEEAESAPVEETVEETA